MNKIPEELKLYILRFLDVISLGKMILVSKDFNNLTNTFVENMLSTLFERYYYPYTINYLSSCSSNLEKLNKLIGRYDKKCLWIIGGYTQIDFVEVTHLVPTLGADIVEPPLKFFMNDTKLFYSRYNATAAIHKGDMFIAAGSNAYEKDLGTTDRYNLFEQKWNRINQVMKYHLSGQTLISYRNILYMIGGYYTEMSLNPDAGYDSEDENMPVHFKSDIYYFRDDNSDKLNGKWVNINEKEIEVEDANNIIRHPLPFGRGQAVAIVYNNNLVLAGGYSDIKGPQKLIFTYNGATDQWDENLIPPLSTITLILKFVVIQNELYAIGHNVEIDGLVTSPSGNLCIEKLHCGHWVVVEEYTKCIRMNCAVESFGDVIYIFGGRDEENSFSHDPSFQSYDAYDVVKKIWLSDLFPLLSERIMGVSNKGTFLQSVNGVAVKLMDHDSKILW